MLLIVLFYVLFVCNCVLYYCHRVSNPVAVNKFFSFYYWDPKSFAVLRCIVYMYS